ncbi:MAG: hypothetical protein KatS3mg002_0324 [Candidatus Woesearchaeota archaeon]|nr:MAG: hypothetical protein KatS3mg002_0324 [Candidatus Woesearchaeota archaeon]
MKTRVQPIRKTCTMIIKNKKKEKEKKKCRKKIKKEDYDD